MPCAIRTVLLIPGTELGWTDLRALLRALPTARIAGETVDTADAIALAQSEQPDVILATTTIADAPTLPLLAAIKAHVPASLIHIFAPRFDAQELAAYAALGTAGYLVWGDLSQQALHDCLAAILAADVHISSQSAVDAFMETVRDPTRLRATHVHLTARERVVLARLAEGMTQTQIADNDEELSLRTVKRTVKHLQEKLDAPSQFLLGKRAAQLGLI